MNISEGLFEVIVSKKLSLEQKAETIRLFAYPLRHLDGELEGYIEPGEITAEDAELIIESLGNVEVKQ